VLEHQRSVAEALETYSRTVEPAIEEIALLNDYCARLYGPAEE
jgi:hypothetical protein